MSETITITEKPLYKEIDGRIFNNQNEMYSLPADNVEYQRLNRQHAALTAAFGGINPPVDLLDAVLAPDAGDGGEKTALDLGFGTGIWSIEMAQKYPHVKFTGIDLVPCPLNAWPANCSWEIHDVNHGLEKWHGKFDLVYIRFLWAIKDFAKFLQDAADCVKPGGAILIIEGDMFPFKSDQLHLIRSATDDPDDSIGCSWFRRFGIKVRETHNNKNIDSSGPEKMIDRGWWEYPGFDQESCGTGSGWISYGKWVNDPDPEKQRRLDVSSTLFVANMKDWIRANGILLSRNGVDKTVIDEWITKIDDEFETARLKSWTRFRFSYGRKLMGDGSPAQPIAKKPEAYKYPPTSSEEATETETYQQVHHYPTKELTFAWIEWRTKQKEQLLADEAARV